MCKFGEASLDLQCLNECCTSCDNKSKRDFNARQALILLMQAILDLGQLKTYKEGLKEEVLIGWLRGSKKDTYLVPDVQVLMEKTQSYSSGTELVGVKCSNDWWSRVLRQAVNLEYIDIKFNILRCKSFTRAWRQYNVSEKGRQFLNSPHDVNVLDPANSPFDEKVKRQENTIRKRTGRGHHHMPKIKECLSRSNGWKELTRAEEYEFPGFALGSQSCKSGLLFVKDCRRLSFAPNARPHFMWDDNQLTTRGIRKQPSMKY